MENVRIKLDVKIIRLLALNRIFEICQKGRYLKRRQQYAPPCRKVFSNGKLSYKNERLPCLRMYYNSSYERFFSRNRSHHLISLPVYFSSPKVLLPPFHSIPREFQRKYACYRSIFLGISPRGSIGHVRLAMEVFHRFLTRTCHLTVRTEFPLRYISLALGRTSSLCTANTENVRFT